jgi:hypothetical protein
MLTFDKKLTNGIFGGSPPKFNVELLQMAKDKNYHIPGGYFPAMLKKEYLENDFAKFRKSYTWNPDKLAWTRAIEAFEHIFNTTLVAPVLSFKEAVSMIELSASPGFPWNLNGKYQTKRACLTPQSEGGQYELIEKIVNGVFLDGKVDFEYEGVRYTEVFWQTSPKSEIRVIEKLNDPDPSKRKVRTFMCGDFITHIVGFMLYKNQNDELLRNPPPNSWVGVGTNPWYGGWHRMCEALLRNGSKKFHCMDASHMEASLNSEVQAAIYGVRNRALKKTSSYKVAQEWFFLSRFVTH